MVRSAQASGVLDIELPHPVPVVIDFIKLLFGEWRAVVKMECVTGFEPSLSFLISTDTVICVTTLAAAGSWGGSVSDDPSLHSI